MPIVNSTSVFKIKAQEIAQLRQSPFAHSKNKKIRRIRQKNAFHNAILKHPEKNVVYLVYRNGKCVMLGCKSAKEVSESAEWLRDELQTELLELPLISNFVFTYSTTFEENTPRILEHIYGKVLLMNTRNGSVIRSFGSYEPELSPAFIYYPVCVRKAKAMIFSSGKITITGITCEDQIQFIQEEVSKFT